MIKEFKNESRSFISGLKVSTPNLQILNINIYASRSTEIGSIEFPGFQAKIKYDSVLVEFYKPENWFHLIIDVMSEGNTEPTLEIDYVLELSNSEVTSLLCTKKIAFLGLARNCESRVTNTIERFQHFGTYFKGHKIFVYENDSNDETGSILRNLSISNSNIELIREANLDALMPKRTERLAYARNRLLDRVLNDEKDHWDYICWGDMDGLVDNRFTDESFLSNFQLESVWDGVFPVTEPLYYDMWALREDTLCPGDYIDQAMRELNSAIDSKNIMHTAIQHLKAGNLKGWLPVKSAFGGFGIYKNAAARQGRYIGMLPNGIEACEHVEYNLSLSRSGSKLYINPNCITHLG